MYSLSSFALPRLSIQLQTPNYSPGILPNQDQRPIVTLVRLAAGPSGAARIQIRVASTCRVAAVVASNIVTVGLPIARLAGADIPLPKRGGYSNSIRPAPVGVGVALADRSFGKGHGAGHGRALFLVGDEDGAV
jgi:hypothetical protein